MDGAAHFETRHHLMSDLEPLLSVTTAVDPYATRMLTRSLSPEVDFRALGATGTSCSIVAVDDVSNVVRQLEDDGATLMDRIRCEVVVMADTDARSTSGLRGSRGRRPIRPRRFGKPSGGRACVLGEAIDRCSNEFVVVSGPSADPLTGIPEALGHMWVDGADIAVLPRSPAGLMGDSGESLDSLDVAAAIPTWMGLRPSDGSQPVLGPETLVLRRWLARWIFNEMDRAIDPAMEIADRIRLLGVTVVQIPVSSVPDHGLGLAG